MAVKMEREREREFMLDNGFIHHHMPLHLAASSTVTVLENAGGK